MLNEPRWQVTEKLLQRLIAADFHPELACDMVTSIEIDLDQAEVDDTIADLDMVAKIHAENLSAIRQRLYEMLRRTMNTPKHPALHLVPNLLDAMLRNVARQYKISLSA